MTKLNEFNREFKRITRTEDIPDDAQFSRFPGWDSFAHVQLMRELELITGTKISLSKSQSLNTIKKIEVFLAEHS